MRNRCPNLISSTLSPTRFALVAQWIERLSPEQKAEGSIPFEGTNGKTRTSSGAGLVFSSHPRFSTQPRAEAPSGGRLTKESTLPFESMLPLDSEAARPRADTSRHRSSQQALRLTALLNSAYYTPEQVRQLLGELTGRRIDEMLPLFPPLSHRLRQEHRPGPADLHQRRLPLPGPGRDQHRGRLPDREQRVAGRERERAARGEHRAERGHRRRGRAHRRRAGKHGGGRGSRPGGAPPARACPAPRLNRRRPRPRSQKGWGRGPRRWCG